MASIKLYVRNACRKDNVMWNMASAFDTWRFMHTWSLQLTLLAEVRGQQHFRLRRPRVPKMLLGPMHLTFYSCHTLCPTTLWVYLMANQGAHLNPSPNGPGHILHCSLTSLDRVDRSGPPFARQTPPTDPGELRLQLNAHEICQWNVRIDFVAEVTRSKWNRSRRKRNQ